MFIAQFPVTRTDDNVFFLVFSQPRTALNFPPDGILVELSHQTYGTIHNILHFFSYCELNKEMCSKTFWTHPALPAIMEVQLWPRHIDIILGNVVWRATPLTISENRMDGIPEGHVTETPPTSEPPTPSLNDEDWDEDTNLP